MIVNLIVESVKIPPLDQSKKDLYEASTDACYAPVRLRETATSRPFEARRLEVNYGTTHLPSVLRRYHTTYNTEDCVLCTVQIRDKYYDR